MQQATTPDRKAPIHPLGETPEGVYGKRLPSSSTWVLFFFHAIFSIPSVETPRKRRYYRVENVLYEVGLPTTKSPEAAAGGARSPQLVSSSSRSPTRKTPHYATPLDRFSPSPPRQSGADGGCMPVAKLDRLIDTGVKSQADAIHTALMKFTDDFQSRVPYTNHIIPIV